jgi:hypothetical protein
MIKVETEEISISDKINKALDGRSQVWLVDKVKEYGETNNDDNLKLFTDVKLSRRMKEREDWKSNELKAIGKILKIKL